jgi:hypothetical protein
MKFREEKFIKIINIILFSFIAGFYTFLELIDVELSLDSHSIFFVSIFF